MSLEDFQEEINPRDLLDGNILEVIDKFVKEHRDLYVEFDPRNPDSHYYDCAIFSQDLQRELQRILDYSIQIIHFSLKEKIKIFGREHIYPKHFFHAAVYIRELNVIIEPQTGECTFWIEDGPFSAFDYYSSILGVDKGDMALMTTNEIIKKGADKKESA